MIILILASLIVMILILLVSAIIKIEYEDYKLNKYKKNKHEGYFYEKEKDDKK